MKGAQLDMNTPEAEPSAAPRRRRAPGSKQAQEFSPGTVYESGRKRREEILDAATTLFGEYGYTGVSMRDVAAATGVTHAGLRYHFPSKDALLLAVLVRLSDLGDEYYNRAVIHASAEPPNFWGVLEEFISYLRFTNSQRLKTQMFIMHAILAADENHAAHDFFEHRYANMRAQYMEIFGLLQSQGFLLESLNYKAAAVELIAMSDGLQVQWLLDPVGVNYKVVIEQAVRQMLRPEHYERFDAVVANIDLPELSGT